MEKIQQWWRIRWSYKNATVAVCLFNLVAALFLLHGFLFPPSSHHNFSVEKHIKESEEIRRAMIPVDLIKRVREIEKEVYAEQEPDKQLDVKQTAAVGLISRLNNFRSYSDAGNLKALEEWRKRKMERDRRRQLEKNGTILSQS